MLVHLVKHLVNEGVFDDGNAGVAISAIGLFNMLGRLEYGQLALLINVPKVYMYMTPLNGVTTVVSHDITGVNFFFSQLDMLPPSWKRILPKNPYWGQFLYEMVLPVFIS